MSSIGTMVINLMARTEAFEKSMDRASGKVESFNKTMGQMSHVAGISAKAFTVAKGLEVGLNAATAYHKALREGDNAWKKLLEDVVSQTPVFGAAFVKFTKEVKGYEAAMVSAEKTTGAMKSWQGLGSLNRSLVQGNESLLVGKDKKAELDALHEYQNSMQRILDYQLELTRLKKLDAESLSIIAKSMKLVETQYQLQLRAIEENKIAENDKLRIDAENDKLQEKYSALEDILNAEQSYADTLRAEQGMTNEMISLLHIRERIEKTMQGAELEAAEKRLDVLQKDLELEKKISDQKKKNEYRNKLIGSLDPTIAMAQYMHELEVNGIDPNSLEYKKAVEDKYNSLSPPIEFQRGTAEVISGFSDVKGLSMNAKEPAVEKKFDEIIKILNSSNTFLSTISRQSWN